MLFSHYSVAISFCGSTGGDVVYSALSPAWQSVFIWANVIQRVSPFLSGLGGLQKRNNKAGLQWDPFEADITIWIHVHTVKFNVLNADCQLYFK